jgi:hypothetical protein
MIVPCQSPSGYGHDHTTMYKTQSPIQQYFFMESLHQMAFLYTRERQKISLHRDEKYSNSASAMSHMLLSSWIDAYVKPTKLRFEDIPKRMQKKAVS